MNPYRKPAKPAIRIRKVKLPRRPPCGPSEKTIARIRERARSLGLEMPLPIRQEKEKKMPKYAKIGVVSAVFLLAIIGGFLFFKTKPITLEVTGFSWERIIEIEEYTTVRERGTSIPIGGRKITEDEDCDFEYNYNTGTTEYKCETVYLYEIERWIYKRSVAATNTNRNPYWPNPELNSSERISNSQEKYFVNLKDQTGMAYKYSCKEKEWGSYEKSEPVIGKISIFGVRKLLKLERE